MAFQASEWDILPELEGFRHQHQQLLEGVHVFDSFTDLPRGLCPASSEAKAHALLAISHFRCCDDVLRAIGSAASIISSTRKLFTPNVEIEMAGFRMTNCKESMSWCSCIHLKNDLAPRNCRPCAKSCLEELHVSELRKAYVRSTSYEAVLQSVQAWSPRPRLMQGEWQNYVMAISQSSCLLK